MARPIKKVDVALIEKLAAINCSMEEIGEMVGVNRATLQRRYAAVIQKGRSGGTTSLKRKMYELAMGGNITMCIWLSKQMLGYTDKVEQKVVEKVDANLTYKTEWAKEATKPTKPGDE